jgi:membrane protein YdbS with pleckstrin-like domain
MILRDFIIIREGLVGTNFHILHRFKTQHMVEITSPTQRRLGLASMKIQMAFNKLKLPYVPLGLAREVINQNLFLAETSHQHWM